MFNKNFAVLDIGSNSFHIIIANSPDGRRFDVIDREKAVLRLASKDDKGVSFIKEQDIEKAIKLIDFFKTKAIMNRAEIKAVATSAVREAINRDRFVERVAEATGVIINIIDGKEEALYIYRAARHFMQFKNKNVLCVDIGGGSTEFIVGNDVNPIFSTSLRMGAVRFTREFFPDYVVRKNNVIAASHYAGGMVEAIKNEVLTAGYETAIFSAGTAKSVLSMAAANGLIKPEEKVFTYSHLTKIHDLVLSRKEMDDRLVIPGLEAKRADVVVAGVIILKAIFDKLEIKEGYYSEYALREGVLLANAVMQ
ncbi:MAG: Ppx/GppA family phosphatase [Ignavibacteriales bacterium]|jgi:exopolyphosphatase/guanosine-5'-triphosphate,3'-diphosphate pyrophosphatase|nr:Ppx/GppA family phosphatase [Ignavibacteriales bacterium]MBP9122111.1 Ppx/GppA family phosphatase [Ignavibacteriaceae bacterium]MCC6637287.1 Ppx/GppA family phosphatase [Ignavibacteriaceae bacterium]